MGRPWGVGVVALNGARRSISEISSIKIIPGILKSCLSTADRERQHARHNGRKSFAEAPGFGFSIIAVFDVEAFRQLGGMSFPSQRGDVFIRVDGRNDFARFRCRAEMASLS